MLSTSLLIGFVVTTFERPPPWLWTFGMGVWVGLMTMGAIFFAVWLAVNGW